MKATVVQMQGMETPLTLVTWFPQTPLGSPQGNVPGTNCVAKTQAALKKHGLDLSEIRN